MTAYYTMDNTHGYTQTQLDEMNADLDYLLLFNKVAKGDELTTDERHDIIKAHTHKMAQR